MMIVNNSVTVNCGKRWNITKSLNIENIIKFINMYNMYLENQLKIKLVCLKPIDKLLILNSVE